MYLALSDLLIPIFSLLGAGLLLICVGKPVQRYRENRLLIRRRREFALKRLDSSIQQRCIYYISSTDPEFHGQEIQGICEEVRPSCIIVNTNNGMFISNQWCGTTVQVYFHIHEKNKIQFFQFRSLLKEVSPHDGALRLELELPSMLLAGQKRRFVRIFPQQNSIIGLGAWPWALDAPLPENYLSLGSALFSYRTEQEQSCSARLYNISAGGLCLSLQYTTLTRSQPPVKEGGRLLCLLLLQGIQDMEDMALWCCCKILYSGNEPQVPDRCTLRLMFTGWAQGSCGEAPLHWVPVNPEHGIPVLGSWILLRDLEQQTYKPTTNNPG